MAMNSYQGSKGPMAPPKNGSESMGAARNAKNKERLAKARLNAKKRGIGGALTKPNSAAQRQESIGYVRV